MRWLGLLTPVYSTINLSDTILQDPYARTETLYVQRKMYLADYDMEIERTLQNDPFPPLRRFRRKMKPVRA